MYDIICMNIEKILSDNRTSQAAIGMTGKVFNKLLPLFEKALDECTPKNPYRGGRPERLKTSCEKLFFVLYYMKNYPTYDVLGMHFGFNRSSAYKRIEQYTKALEKALEGGKFLPARSIGELNESMGNSKVIIVDGTEQRRNRPKNWEKQKEYYSGKKNITQ